MKDSERPSLELTADIVAAYVSKNPVPINALPDLIASVSETIDRVSGTAAQSQAEKLVPAVPIKKSVTPDYIISLEDGQKFKSLKRHLATRYGMTPEEYREKWGLPADYPMVAPKYAAQRSDLAKKMGLGKKPPAAPAASSRSRKKKLVKA